LNDDKEGPITYQPFDKLSKLLFSGLKVQKKPVSVLGLCLGVPAQELFIDQFYPTEVVFTKSSARMDCVYLLSSQYANLTDSKSKDLHFLVVEFEEENKAENYAKHLYYISAIVERSKTHHDININVYFNVIYGPKVTPFEVNEYNYGCLVFKPQITFLKQIIVDDFFLTLDKKLANNEKASQLDILCLVQLPRKEQFKYEVLKRCVDYLSNTRLVDRRDAGNCYPVIEQTYFKYLNQKQLDEIGRSDMRLFYDDMVKMNERYQQQILQAEEEKRRFAEKASVRIALKLLEQKTMTLPEILNICELSEESFKKHAPSLSKDNA
jgi:hypothetical protein